MVPYSSQGFIDHVFKQLGVQGNSKVDHSAIDKLIEAAKMLRDLVVKMDEGDIKGYIIY